MPCAHDEASFGAGKREERALESTKVLREIHSLSGSARGLRGEEPKRRANQATTIMATAAP